MRRSRIAQRASVSEDESVDPSSTAMTSIFGYVCSTRLSSARSRYGRALKTGMTTLTSGSLNVRSITQTPAVRSGRSSPRGSQPSDPFVAYSRPKQRSAISESSFEPGKLRFVRLHGLPLRDASRQAEPRRGPIGFGQDWQRLTPLDVLPNVVRKLGVRADASILPAGKHDVREPCVVCVQKWPPRHEDRFRRPYRGVDRARDLVG